MDKKTTSLGRMPHAIGAPRHGHRRFSRETENFFRAKENGQYPLHNRLSRAASRADRRRYRRATPRAL